jgi:hypothetical protein
VTSMPSSLDYADDAAAGDAARGSSWGSRVWEFVEARLVALTDRANPILVKETRQALKSRQFVVTFVIVLAACWIVSFAAAAIIGPQMYYAATGASLLVWYYGILAFPLAVIVPYSAFRSLATEQEDNTYELLSITTLSSRQIVTGKLWSAVVQMIVYLSAVSPCLAFTYLLRGVDVVMTGFLLAIAVLGCLGLSMISLFIGAASRAKHTQIITSVALVLALFGAFWMGVYIASELADQSIPRDPEFFAVCVIVLTIYVTTFGLLHAAASAQISFSSENRSTPVRRWMMAQQGALIGGGLGTLYAFGTRPDDIAGTAMVMTLLGSIYWAVMGALLTSEWPHLSRRVQRSLPQSTVGRTFLSFFNPGPGAGYLFAVSNLTAVLLTALALGAYAHSRSTTFMRFDQISGAIVLLWGYVVGYLGLGRIVIAWARRWTFVSLTAGLLFHLLLVGAGVGIPLAIQTMSRSMRNDGYTLLQMSNPFWTLSELLDRGVNSVPLPILVILVPAFGVAMLLLNMKSVAAELLRQRVAPPTRVIEEEAELHPAPVPAPANPWEA